MNIVEIEGMTCAHCVARVTNALAGLPGVKKVKVDLKTNRATVQPGAAEAQLRAAVEEAGYAVRSVQTA